MHTNTKSNTNHLVRSVMFISPIALILAAGMTGCESSSSFTRTNSDDNFTTEGKAQLAAVVIDPSFVEGVFTSESYVAEGGDFALPQEWVSEARSGTADIEAQRANAQAFEVYAESAFTESMASADADLQDAFVSQQTGYADAQRTQTIHNARLAQMDSQISARGVESDSKFKRQETFLISAVQEWQSEIERMRSEADKDWSSSLAKHDHMMTTFQAVQDRGAAEINEMIQIADFTEVRSAYKVKNLRAQAQAVAEQAQAEVSNLNQL
ncbi:MAG: hypothetical protein JKX70_10830, partial [Phycisphaerales bacterium]|nr:hypothetical protein [Phycisphaerales bacterium]